VFAPGDPRRQSLTLALALSERLLGRRGAYRVHGGGFAGTIQAFVPQELTEAYQSEMDAVFGGGSCRPLTIRRHGGVRLAMGD
jgi:galactokinase